MNHSPWLVSEGGAITVERGEAKFAHISDEDGKTADVHCGRQYRSCSCGIAANMFAKASTSVLTS